MAKTIQLTTFYFFFYWYSLYCRYCMCHMRYCVDYSLPWNLDVMIRTTNLNSTEQVQGGIDYWVSMTGPITLTSKSIFKIKQKIPVYALCICLGTYFFTYLLNIYRFKYTLAVSSFIGTVFFLLLLLSIRPLIMAH